MLPPRRVAPRRRSAAARSGPPETRARRRTPEDRAPEPGRCVSQRPVARAPSWLPPSWLARSWRSVLRSSSPPQTSTTRRCRRSPSRGFRTRRRAHRRAALPAVDAAVTARPLDADGSPAGSADEPDRSTASSLASAHPGRWMRGPPCRRASWCAVTTASPSRLPAPRRTRAAGHHRRRDGWWPPARAAQPSGARRAVGALPSGPVAVHLRACTFSSS